MHTTQIMMHTCHGYKRSLLIYTHIGPPKIETTMTCLSPIRRKCRHTLHQTRLPIRNTLTIIIPSNPSIGKQRRQSLDRRGQGKQLHFNISRGEEFIGRGACALTEREFGNGSTTETLEEFAFIFDGATLGCSGGYVRGGGEERCGLSGGRVVIVGG